jgi:O-antigen ligase
MSAPVVGRGGRVLRGRGRQGGSAPAIAHAAGPGTGAYGRWDEPLTYVSMLLLLIATIPGTGLIGDVLKVGWLASVVLLTVLNVGAAFGVYVAALAVFAVLHFGGMGPLLGRPDNYAVLILVAGLVLRLAATRSLGVRGRGVWMVWALVGYGLLHTASKGLLTRSTFMILMWTLGLPMLMFLLLAQYGFALREFRALVCSLLVLGTYMALVSIAERVGWQEMILPMWIADPSVAPILDGLGIPGDPRSGGLLMQPAWNGLALSLIYCLALLSHRLFSRRGRLLAGMGGLLCLVGVFLSDTRAAWLACAFASLVLLWRPTATRARTLLRRFGLVAVSAACLLALVASPHTAARQRLADSGTVFYRLNLWKAAISMVADRPLLGIGFTRFDDGLVDYSQVMTVGCEDPGQPGCLGGRMNIESDAVHNTVLSILVELGAIGLLLYVGAVVAIFRWTRTSARLLWGREGAVWVGVLMGVYFLQAQFAVAHEPTTNLILFGLLGAIAGLTRRGLAGTASGVTAAHPAWA